MNPKLLSQVGSSGLSLFSFAFDLFRELYRFQFVLLSAVHLVFNCFLMFDLFGGGDSVDHLIDEDLSLSFHIFLVFEDLVVEGCDEVDSHSIFFARSEDSHVCH